MSISNIFPAVGVHGEHHLEFALYVTLAIIILYMPPKAAGRLNWLQSFIDAHFGDSVGLYLLHLGIALVILAGVWPEMTQVGQVGQSLILAAMGVLKLKSTPGADLGPTDSAKVTQTTNTVVTASKQPEPPAAASPTNPALHTEQT